MVTNWARWVDGLCAVCCMLYAVLYCQYATRCECTRQRHKAGGSDLLISQSTVTPHKSGSGFGSGGPLARCLALHARTPVKVHTPEGAGTKYYLPAANVITKLHTF